MNQHFDAWKYTYGTNRMINLNLRCKLPPPHPPHLESDWETLWHTVAFRPRMSPKNNKISKKVIFRRVIALFLYFFKISL